MASNMGTVNVTLEIDNRDALVAELFDECQRRRESELDAIDRWQRWMAEAVAKGFDSRRPPMPIEQAREVLAGNDLEEKAVCDFETELWELLGKYGKGRESNTSEDLLCKYLSMLVA